MNKKIEDFNRQSLIKFKERNKEIVESNPHFFDEDSMSSGFQTFDVRQENNKRFLTVEREVPVENTRIELPTAIYELDDSNRVVKFFKHLTKKVTKLR